MRQFLAQSIRRRLAFSFAAVTLLTAAVLGLLLLAMLNVYYERRERQHLLRNAWLVNEVLGEALADGTPLAAFQPQLTGLALVTQTRLRLYDGDGRLLADSGSPRSLSVDLVVAPGTPELATGSTVTGSVYLAVRPAEVRLSGPLPPLPPAGMNENLAGQAAALEEQAQLLAEAQLAEAARQAGRPLPVPPPPFVGDVYGVGAGREFAGSHLNLPVIDDEGQVIGWLELAGGPDYGRGIVLGVAVAWALASLAAVLLAATAGWALSRRLSLPLVELTTVTSQMAEGDLSVRAGVQRQDEIGSLASAFNEMATRLEATIAALRRFVADAAHEINTPLTALRNSLDLAVEETDQTAQLKLVQHGQTQVKRLEALARDLLDLSRLEVGAQKGGETAVDLTGLLLKSSEIAAAQAEQAGLHFEVALPASPEPIIVMGDEKKLQRVLGNLVDNAVKFTPEDGTVTVGLAANSNYATLWVADTGIGIPEQELTEVFSHFHRGRNAAAYPGSGLGLAIVKAIVEKHGGQVTAENLSPGTRFSIQLLLMP